jgi:tetrahydromethanopterin S-methyltransferase subunit G
MEVTIISRLEALEEKVDNLDRDDLTLVHQSLDEIKETLGNVEQQLDELIRPVGHHKLNDDSGKLDKVLSILGEE